MTEFDKVLGQHLYRVRRAQQLEAADIERLSCGRWPASTIAAIEEGTHTLTLAETAELAGFFDVPLRALLPAHHLREDPEFGTPPIVIDVDELEVCPRRWAPKLRMFVRSVQALRNEHDSDTVAIRHDDIADLSRILKLPARELVAQLAAARILVETPNYTATFTVDRRTAHRAMAAMVS